ncbi:large subunit ribosomal protein L34e [Nematocida homosporus]|uniref:large subunit ribosomal protein L34e n=1 Tax=Nematocida homosporus TaxID=1912981 RepID=UPI002220CF18|nr:large subunit ribosomal protein L34e [Nematocida homosporus]KAI5184263.1 large subunit ribosomal protein L34e [Nematocida homosporus]
MAERVVRAGYNPYVTPSNIMKLVKNKKGKLIHVKQKKAGSYQKCGDCKERLQGILPMRPVDFARQTKSQRTVNRVHGGSICAKCVEGRILKSFFQEEKKHVKEISQ